MPKSMYRRRRQGRGLFRRPFLEQFEDRRLLAAVITVNSTDDTDVRDAVLTLREAIEVSNGTLAINTLSSSESLQVTGAPDGVKPNTIGFNIQSSVAGAVETISPTSELPAITAPVLIDGYTQPGAAANTNAIDDPNPTKRGFNGTLLIELSGVNGISDGLTLTADGSTIRGLVVDAFGGTGIIVNGAKNTIGGNFIGVDPGGTQRRGNGNGIFITSANNHIGGATPDARNVISGSFSFHGIELQGTGATGNVIQGNFIGTDASGTIAVPNAESGISLTQASNNTIGGAQSGARNVISGNGPPANGDGISLFFSSNGNAIQGNYIGVDATGAQGLGNGVYGIGIRDSNGNAIGGASAGEGNVIAFNGSSGVEVASGDVDSLNNSILSNSIFSNVGLGIDLDLQGVIPNDTGDADRGSNNLQNFPEFTSAPQLSSGSLTVTYRVPSDPVNSAYPLRIEFFKADSSGQGQTFLGFDTYDSANASAPKTVTFQPKAVLAVGDKIVTTATDSAQAGGNTSEFSAAALVTTPNSPPQITSNGGGDTAAVSVPESTTAVTQVVATDPDPNTTLSYSINGGADAAQFTIDPQSGLLQFVNPPDFEHPTDAGGNNVYDVIVQASDGSLTDTQTIAVTVTNVNESPVITSNGGLDQANISIPENTTAVADVDATDPDAGTTLSYSIGGGTDAALFSIDPTTGVLKFITAPDFEHPTDANADNVYVVVVQASDGSLNTGQSLLVSVTDVNEPPVITSNGGGATASVSIPENTTAVTTVTATDPDASDIPTLVFSISGGADASKFSINSSTGAVAFVSAPDFENPTDAGGNNVYDVVVQASDGTLTDTQALAVTVTDAIEPADLQISNDDGVQTATPGTVLKYTIVVTNGGPTPVNGAIVHDDFPAGFAVTAVTATGAGGASGFSNNVAGNQLNQTVNLPVGASITYAVTGSVSASATGSLSNTATVTAPATISDTNPSNNTATDADTLTTSADLKVTQSASPDPVKAGGNLTYTITVSNAGVSDAQSVSLTGNIPVNTTFVSLTGPAGWKNATPAPGGTGGFKSDISTLAVGKGPQIFTLVVNVNATAPDGSTISNTVIVDTASHDPDPTNNKAIQTTAVIAQTGTGGIVDDHYVTNEDQTLTVTFSPPGVLANDSSIPPEQPLFATLVAGPAHGKVQLKPDGTFVYTPSPNFFGTDHFLYGASTSVASKAIFAATWNFNASAREWGKLYQIAPGTTQATLIGKLMPPPGVRELSQPMGLAFTPQGKLYLLTGGYLMDVNPQTAALTVIGRKSSVAINEGDLVYNPADGLLYASGAAKDSLVRIDPATGVRTVIGPMGASGRDVSALAFGADGTLYGVALRDASPDLFVQIDTQTGHATAIGLTGTNETIKVLSGMAFDPAANRLYFTLGSTAYLIDPLTGQATSIGTIQASGLPIGYISALALEGPALSIGNVSIDVLPVNDAPRFVAGSNQTVGNDFGPQALPGWATAISPGAANESQQHLNFVLNADQPNLFSVEPTVDAGGTLRYTPAPGAAGTTSITISLHDDGGTANGGVDTSAQQTFTITVVPAPGPTGVFLVAGTLRINGGLQADAASVTLKGNRLLVNGTIGGAHVNQSFLKAQVQRIEAYLGDGNDSLTIGGTVRTPVFVDAGAGNDTIRAGGGPAVFVGGDGNDRLTGGANRDVLIGGSGADTLSGGGNSDLLIAGTTAFDQNKAALLAIQAEWTSNRSLSQRMADLRNGAGPFLQPLGVKLVQNSTVLNDTDVDTVFGGGDLDWFFADLTKDKLKDRLNSEKVG